MPAQNGRGRGAASHRVRVHLGGEQIDRDQHGGGSAGVLLPMRGAVLLRRDVAGPVRDRHRAVARVLDDLTRDDVDHRRARLGTPASAPSRRRQLRPASRSAGIESVECRLQRSTRRLRLVWEGGAARFLPVPIRRHWVPLSGSWSFTMLSRPCFLVEDFASSWRRRSAPSM